MEQTKGQIRALDILTRTEAGESRADIAKSYGVSESSIYFETRFGRVLRYRDQHPDDRATIGAWGAFDKLWGRTTKTSPEHTRFAELICALPLATDVQTKADKRSAKIAAVESAKAPRKMTKAEFESVCTPALDPIADKRAKKTLAQRLRRAAAKAKVQWRGDPELTAAAGE